MNSTSYFMFSTTELNQKKAIKQRIGREYTPGQVLSNGVYKQFTSILLDPNLAKFPDSIIVASGTLSQMKYKKPR